MSTKEQLGKLNRLLARVQSRAGAPRGNGNGAHGAHVMPVQPVFATAEYVSPGQATPMPSHAAQGADVDELLTRAPSTHPATHPPVEAAAAAYDDDMDSAEVEVSETVEIDIDVDEPMAMESGAQPIAHPTMPPEDLEEVEEEEPPRPTNPPSGDELEEVAQVAQATAANEIEEPAPSSSRRPIAGEEAPAEAYEGESAPRHTPPPESGKQVAAAPSAHPPSRKPSAAPPTAPEREEPEEHEEREDRTLIGGWREPGLGAPPMSLGSPPASAPRPAEVPPAQPSGRRLSPDVTRPNLAGGNVAAFAGAAPVAKPTTLGELLDMTLGL